MEKASKFYKIYLVFVITQKRPKKTIKKSSKLKSLIFQLPQNGFIFLDQDNSIKIICRPVKMGHLKKEFVKIYQEKREPNKIILFLTHKNAPKSSDHHGL